MAAISQTDERTVQASLAPAAFDPQVILARLGGDMQLVVEVIEMFLDDYQRLVGDVRDAAIQRDASKLERAAHKLRGAIGHFAVSAAYEAAGQLESMGHENRMEHVPAAIDALAAGIEALAAALQQFVAAQRIRST